MTNRERLMALDDAGFAAEIAAYATCPVREHVDFEAWLSNEAVEYPIYGTKGRCVLPDGKVCDAVIVGQRTIMGNLYAQVVVKCPGLHRFDAFSIPAGSVEILSP